MGLVFYISHNYTTPTCPRHFFVLWSVLGDIRSDIKFRHVLVLWLHNFRFRCPLLILLSQRIFHKLLKKHTRVEINKDSPERYNGIALIGEDLFSALRTPSVNVNGSE